MPSRDLLSFSFVGYDPCNGARERGPGPDHGSRGAVVVGAPIRTKGLTSHDRESVFTECDTVIHKRYSRAERHFLEIPLDR